jgi:hypothetical protein
MHDTPVCHRISTSGPLRNHTFTSLSTRTAMHPSPEQWWNCNHSTTLSTPRDDFSSLVLAWTYSGWFLCYTNARDDFASLVLAWTYSGWSSHGRIQVGPRMDVFRLVLAWTYSGWSLHGCVQVPLLHEWRRSEVVAVRCAGFTDLTRGGVMDLNIPAGSPRAPSLYASPTHHMLERRCDVCVKYVTGPFWRCAGATSSGTSPNEPISTPVGIAHACDSVVDVPGVSRCDGACM